jgi:hypothetical protein
MRHTVLVFLVVVLAAFLSPSVHAQGICDSQWIPDGGGASATNGQVFASTMWDPDGPGPQTAKYVVGGTFTGAGAILASNIAAFDPATGAWSAIGNGLAGSQVEHLAAHTDGRLVAVYRPTPFAPTVAVWNGSAWTSLGATNSYAQVNALKIHPTGDIYLAGGFSSIGGVPAVNIARWNGSAWSALGAGLNNRVNAVAFRTNGEPVAGGFFTASGATSIPYLARWDGSAWQPESPNTPIYQVDAMTILANDDVIIGVRVWPGFGVEAYATIRRRSVGFGWQTIGQGTQNGLVKSITPLDGNRFFVWGNLGRWPVTGGTFEYGFVRYTGTGWASLGTTQGALLAREPAGSFLGVGGDIVRWDGNTNWTALSQAGTNGQVRTIAPLPTGGYVAGGDFSRIGNLPASNIARFDGSAWNAMGSGVNGTVYSSLTLPDGSVIVGGTFSTAGEVSASKIARWDGTAWHALGSGIAGQNIGNVSAVYALALAQNGDIIAGGYFEEAGGLPVNNVARWNGATWSPVGSGLAGVVYDLHVRPSGEIVAGGSMSQTGSGLFVNSIAGYNGGTSWYGFWLGMNGSVLALATLADGSLLASGDFLTAGDQPAPSRMATWNPGPQTWSPYPSAVIPGTDPGAANQSVRTLDFLPNGDLLAHGRVWSGTAWSLLAPGLPQYDQIYDQAVLYNGDVVIAGYFLNVNGAPVTSVARWTAGECPCDDIDFNNDGVTPDSQDITDLLSVFGGGPCSTDPTPGCNDIDVNNDGVSPDITDIDTFLRLYGGGNC